MRWPLVFVGIWLLAGPAWTSPTSWSPAESLAMGLLDAGAGPAELKAAFAKRDNTIDVSALQLAAGAWLVTLSRFEDSADVFMAAREPTGYAATWRLGDAEADADGDFKPLRAWSAAGGRADCRQNLPDADWADCGPIAPEIGRLPIGAGGASRFWLRGVYAQEAGETESAQLSLWRWDGKAAWPLLVRTFQFRIDEDLGPSVAGGLIRMHVKDDFKTMLSCGACPGRQRTWRFGLTADGAQDLGERSLTPELDLADELFDRAARHRPLAGLASPSAAQAIAARLAVIDTQSRWPMGTLKEWLLSWDRRRLCLATDGGGTWLLTLRRNQRSLAAERASYIGEGLCDDTLHWRSASRGS
jgi:hypothetical protein